MKQNRFGAAIMFTFISFGALAEVVSYWMVSHGVHNRWVLHFYQLGEYILLMLAFSFWQTDEDNRGLDEDENRVLSVFKPRYLRWSIFFYGIFWLISKWSFEPWEDLGSYTLAVSTFIFILLSLFTLYGLISLREKREGSILRNFRFWMAVGVLVYFAGSAVDFLMLSVLVNLPRSEFLNLWTFHWLVNVVANLAYAYGFLCLTQQYTP